MGERKLPPQSQPDYTPSKLAIWRGCRQFQAGWTAEERERRRRYTSGGNRGPGIRLISTLDLLREGIRLGDL